MARAAGVNVINGWAKKQWTPKDFEMSQTRWSNRKKKKKRKGTVQAIKEGIRGGRGTGAEVNDDDDDVDRCVCNRHQSIVIKCVTPNLKLSECFHIPTQTRTH